MFSFEEVVTELEHKIAVKTLKNWANKVEKLTDTKFTRKKALNVNGNTYSYKVFEPQDIERFSKVLELRAKKMPLDEALIEAFMSEEGKEEQEMITIAKASHEEMRGTIKRMTYFVEKFLEENAQLKKRVKRLELEMGITED
ncbi:hypothetical protein KI096_002801 [Enterococcus faecalis]|uniref:hypothetical protein n=1 Tax=Enterococcus faecalis TaxID=1351 RepID=UPI0027F81D25|nr:hypothetical protein [Enterococcus faecalis]EHQ8834538.1 hypothetical protein [Enterococcus faecalis]EJG4482704.1 hypothetical protein [Enterococcus faecalis]EKZ0111328.1 hypothetical protein [Enterococcus faecalis]MDR9789049.1 hypothetical protein [Enterococcus faecalis]